MGKEIELQKRIIELKLEKRDLVLAGKSTDQIDEKIKIVEKELSN